MSPSVVLTKEALDASDALGSWTISLVSLSQKELDASDAFDTPGKYHLSSPIFCRFAEGEGDFNNLGEGENW